MVSLVAALAHGFRRHPWVVVNVILLFGVGAAGYSRLVEARPTRISTPADLFMQSIATEDGDLGWKQLCPSLQNELPRDVLEQQTVRQRSAQIQDGVTLTIDHVGDRARPTGGEVHFYVATAHSADGSTGQKTYVVMTQASGCVESVE